MSTYAMIKSGVNEVINTIMADDSFPMDGFYFVEIGSDVFCQTGMFYNEAVNLFYDDEEFTKINGIEV